MSQPAEKNNLGVFGGVFTPCVLTILGVILFMRANYVVGAVGAYRALLILVFAEGIVLATSFSTSAVCTNTRMRGGGAYFLISRVLGPEYGGVMGIALFAAQAVSVPFYLLGFAEAFCDTLPGLGLVPWRVAAVAAAVLLFIGWTGAKWAVKVQYGILAVLALSLLVAFAGIALVFSPETLARNWAGPVPGDPSVPGGVFSPPFWAMFALYFPAVTGIMAGINMSGDLRDPARSIPLGVFLAVGAGFLVYAGQIVLYAGAMPREELLLRPYLVMTENALLGAGFLVTAGVFAATLSSALGSLLAAPRVLQAMARDEVVPLIRVFAQGTAIGDEPRRGVLLTGGITFAVLAWAGHTPGGAGLNMVASAITILFLAVYSTINAAAFIEGITGNPSFRPQFRFFHWGIALAGLVASAAVAFIISPMVSLGVLLVLLAMYQHARRVETRASFGDVRRGLSYARVRRGLLQLTRMEESPKNWRPTCLVFSGRPESRETLVDYAAWFEADKGIVLLAEVLVGDMDTKAPERLLELNRLNQGLAGRSRAVFPLVLVAEQLDQGIRSILQTAGMGPIRPNLAMFAWTSTELRAPALAGHIRRAFSFGMSVLVLHEGARPPRDGARRIDVWWRGQANGNLMALLGHLLTQNWEWRGARLRLLRQVRGESDRARALAGLADLLVAARVAAEPVVVASEKPFGEILRDLSGDADCVFLGLNLPNPGAETDWYRACSSLFPADPTIVLALSKGDADITA